MFAFLAYTGCRRSELVRSELSDIDFDERQIVIREKKRCKVLCESIRHVPMHDRLGEILQDWLEVHPGGRWTFVAPLEMPGRRRRENPEPLTVDAARNQFDAALAASKWCVVSGFHVLRHSFGANLARSGRISETTIGEWMGHTTREMRKLYQHLFPQDGVGQINALD